MQLSVTHNEILMLGLLVLVNIIIKIVGNINCHQSLYNLIAVLDLVLDPMKQVRRTHLIGLKIKWKTRLI